MPKKKTTPPHPEDAQAEAGKVGRPTKLTPEVIEEFTTAVSIGSTYTLAALYAKISLSAVELWMSKGRKELEKRESGGKATKANEIFVEFIRAVREAEADAGITWQTTVNAAAKVDPAWAWKMLRVRFGKGYLENDIVANISIPEDMPTEFLDMIIAGKDPLDVIAQYNASKIVTTPSASPKTKKTA